MDEEEKEDFICKFCGKLIEYNQFFLATPAGDKVHARCILIYVYEKDPYHLED